ncbi:unnamed protein product [Arabidopsis halleri]
MVKSEVSFSNSSSRICSSQEQSSSPRSLIPQWQIFTEVNFSSVVNQHFREN